MPHHDRYAGEIIRAKTLIERIDRGFRFYEDDVDVTAERRARAEADIERYMALARSA